MTKATILFLLFIPVLSFSQSNSAILLNKETIIDVTGSKLVERHSLELLILNKDGEKYTNIEIPYSKISRISNISASVQKPDEEIIYKIKNSDIEDRSRLSGSTFFDDIRVKSFYLSHNTYPYIISYSYTLTTTEFIQISDWHPMIDNNVKTVKASLTLNIPEDYKVDIIERGIQPATSATIKSGKQYYWESSYEGNIKPELFAPALYEILPCVRINAIDFKYEITGNLSSWSDFGDWQYRLLTNNLSISSTDRQEIENLTRNIDDKNEKIRLLYHYLQDNTRYVNVSLKTGGLKPYPASFVSEKKYGDCKALTNYFRNILKAAGIESYYTKVYAGTNPIKIDTQHPGQQFNHIILLVPLEQDSLWLDCTSKGPFAYLGSFTQNRRVLMVKNGGSRIISTPALSTEETKNKRMVEINYSGNNNCSARINYTFRGEQFEAIRSIRTNYNKSDQEILFRNILELEDFEINDYSIIPYSRDDREISVASNASSLGIYRKYGNEIIAKNISFNLPDLEDADERQLELRIHLPQYLIDSIYYDIPAGYVSKNTDKKEFINRLGAYSWEAKAEEGRILVVKKFVLESGEINIDEYADFKDFLQSVIISEKRNYILFTKP